MAENGAVIDVPAGYFPGPDTFLGSDVSRADLQAIYKELKQAGGYDCEAFFELGVDGIVRETGLTRAQAAAANDRKASEPIRWRDNKARAVEFEQAALARGLHCTMGGRFLHLMGNTGKDKAVAKLLDAYARTWPDVRLTSVSLGDGPNDLGMLASTDIAVVIPGKHEHPMTLTSQNRVLKPGSPGPAGWNEAMMAILAEH